MNNIETIKTIIDNKMEEIYEKSNEEYEKYKSTDDYDEKNIHMEELTKYNYAFQLLREIKKEIIQSNAGQK